MKTNLRLLLASMCALGTIVSAAPLDVTGSVGTVIENLGGDTRRVTQTLSVTDPSDPETNDDGVTFDIRKAGEFFPSSTIQSVRVTVTYSVDDVELTLTNNSGGTAGGSPGDRSEAQNVWDAFTIGAATTDAGFTNIDSSDFAGNLLTLDLSGGVAPTDTATAGPSDYTHTESHDVIAAAFGTYSGTGTFNNVFDTTIGIFSNVTGAGIDNSQSVGNVSLFFEVEYIVIPEPGTMALAGLAFASAGGIFLIRRKRR